MEGKLESGSAYDQSSPVPECESKILSEKRLGDGLDEMDEFAQKRVKMRDPECFLRSSENEEVCGPLQGGEEMIKVATVGSEETEADEFRGDAYGAVVKPNLRGFHLNREVGKPNLRGFHLSREVGLGNVTVKDESLESAENSEKIPVIGKHAELCGDKVVASRGIDLDFNSEDIKRSANEEGEDEVFKITDAVGTGDSEETEVGESRENASRGVALDLNYEDITSSNQDPVYASENFNHVKASDGSEFGSKSGLQEEKYQLTILNEMKQIGFLSSSHIGIPIPMPKEHERKHESGSKKSVIAKKDQVDRFVKMASPGGLLKVLNPAITNSARNRKQAHSVIDTLGMSENDENVHLQGKQKSHVDTGTKGACTGRDVDKVNDAGAQELNSPHSKGHMHVLLLTGERRAKNFTTSISKFVPFISENKGDTGKKKSVIAKKDQVDQYVRMASPSGRVKVLNPAITNYARNRKQVHSVIETLAVSKKHKNIHLHGKQKSHVVVGTKRARNGKDVDKVNVTGAQKLNFPCSDGRMDVLTGERQAKNYTTPMSKTIPFISENKCAHGMPSMVPKFCSALSLSAIEDETLALKLSSANQGSEKPASLNEESAKLNCVSSLSEKAANVALQLLQQDINRRLAALRRSKKKVRAVITTELPLLISKECPSNRENNPYGLRNSVDGFSSNSTAAMECTFLPNGKFTFRRDTTCEYDNGDKTSAESWLNQLRDMHRHCKLGLQQFPCAEQTGSSGCCWGSNMEASKRELVTRATAASIFSTCDFLINKENV